MTYAYTERECATPPEHIECPDCGEYLDDDGICIDCARADDLADRMAWHEEERER